MLHEGNRILFMQGDYFCVIVFENPLTDQSLKNITEGSKYIFKLRIRTQHRLGLLKVIILKCCCATFMKAEGKAPASHGCFNSPSSALVYLKLAEWAQLWSDRYSKDPPPWSFLTHTSALIHKVHTHTCKEHSEQKRLSSALRLKWRQTHLWALNVRVHWGWIISLPVPHLTSDLSVWVRVAVLNVRGHRVSIGTWSSMPVCTLATKVKYVRGSGWHAVTATVHHHWRRVTEDTHACTHWD